MKGSYHVSGRDRTLNTLDAMSDGMSRNKHIGTGPHGTDHRQDRRERRREERDVKRGRWGDED